MYKKFSEVDIDFCFKQWRFGTNSLYYMLHVQARNVKVFIGLQIFTEFFAITVIYTQFFFYMRTFLLHRSDARD
jgi:hypothetical protein